MPPSEERGARGESAEDMIVRLVEEITGGDPPGGETHRQLDEVEERLTELRQLSAEFEAAAPEAVPEPAVVVAPAAPPRPAAAPASLDAVIIAAAEAGGTPRPVQRPASRPVALPVARRPRPLGGLAFYFSALALVGLALGFFVVNRPLFDQTVALVDTYWTEAAPVAAPSATPAPAAALPAAPAASPEPFAVAEPVVPAILQNRRIVRTFRVGADGRIDLAASDLAD